MTSGRRAVLTAALLLPVGCGRAEERERPPSDSAAIRLGAQVYRAQCASCHGASLQGAPNWKRAGPDGRLPPPPHDSSGHTWHHADGLLYRIVARGTAVAIGDTAHASRYGMPAFESRLSPREIRAVLLYLKSTWTPVQRRHQADLSRLDPQPAVTLER